MTILIPVLLVWLYHPPEGKRESDHKERRKIFSGCSYICTCLDNYSHRCVMGAVRDKMEMRLRMRLIKKPEERSVKEMFYTEGTVKVFGESEMEDVFIRTGALRVFQNKCTTDDSLKRVGLLNARKYSERRLCKNQDFKYLA